MNSTASADENIGGLESAIVNRKSSDVAEADPDLNTTVKSEPPDEKTIRELLAQSSDEEDNEPSKSRVRLDDDDEVENVA